MGEKARLVVGGKLMIMNSSKVMNLLRAFEEMQSGYLRR